MSFLLKNGVSLTPEAELSSNDLLLDFARIGLGITVVPDYVLKSQKKGFLSIKIKRKPSETPACPCV